MAGSRSEKLTLATSFDMIISENLARFAKIVETAQANRDLWAEGAAAHA